MTNMTDMTDMTDKWLKFTLICKPEQSGKTFIMIQSIIKDLQEPIEGKKIINFILCANNLLLTQQTGNRVKSDLNNYIIVEGVGGDKEIYLELSSHKRTEYHNYKDVYHAIMNDNIYNIISCTNGIRMEDIYTLIKDFETGEHTKGKFHFKIWLDEADQYCTYINNTLKPLVDEFNNIDVGLISATVDRLFKKYKYMNVFPLENTTAVKYHGWNDNNLRIIDYSLGYLEFIKHVLYIVGKDRLIPGSKWFIPGKSKKNSHNAIKDVCVAKGMAVIIVNGEGISLTLPKTFEVFQYTKDEEFGKKIVKIYEEHKLDKVPLVITGYICISRGITINSEEFMLDNAILSHCNSKSETSQIAGRMKGNMKHFKNYKKPDIFTTPRFNKIAIEMETKSRNLAELAYKKEQVEGITIINEIEYKTCGDKNKFKYILHHVLFETIKAAKEFLESKKREMKSKSINLRGAWTNEETGGYLVSTKLLKPNQTKKDLIKEDRLTIKHTEKISHSRCISSTDKGSRYLVLPVYETMESLPKDVMYQVRYICFKE
jgi:hypothetical protein